MLLLLMECHFGSPFPRGGFDFHGHSDSVELLCVGVECGEFDGEIAARGVGGDQLLAV